MKSFHAKFQIGKKGLTKEFLDSLALAFKNKKQVRVSVLKSFCRDREELEKTAEEIVERLPFKVDKKILGYTIILIKRNSK